MYVDAERALEAKLAIFRIMFEKILEKEEGKKLLKQ
jgi:hypothetical protein